MLIFVFWLSQALQIDGKFMWNTQD